MPAVLKIHVVLTSHWCFGFP